MTYDNLLVVTIGDRIVTHPPEAFRAASIKAATRDVKDYIISKGYRPVSIGTFVLDVSDSSLQEYLLCQPEMSAGRTVLTIDFFVMSRGALSYARLVQLASQFSYLPVAILYDGYVFDSIPDDGFIFDNELYTIWSGTIIYEWMKRDSDPGLVGYDVPALEGTPVPLATYTDMSFHWATLPFHAVHSSAYTLSQSIPGCPTTKPDWTLAGSAPLPTIAGLKLPTGGSNTSTAAASPSQSEAGSANPIASNDHGGLSTGAKAGIGVGSAVFAIALVIIVVVLHRHRRISVPRPTSMLGYDEKPEMDAGRVAESISGPVRPKHELPNKVQRKPLPSELAASGTVKSRASGSSMHGLPELHHIQKQETDTGTFITKQKSPSLPPRPLIPTPLQPLTSPSQRLPSRLIRIALLPLLRLIGPKSQKTPKSQPKSSA